jgi:hypothetical protein
MFRPRTLKPLLIIFALVLASSVSGHAQGVRQEPIRAEGAAGNQQEQHAQNPPAQSVPDADTVYPDAITCSVPVHGAAPGTRIPVPAGQEPTGICPRTAMIEIFFHDSNTGYTKVPISNDPAPPANWDSLDMEQDNIAKDELRALKLRNKTSGQQTSGQPP